MDPVFLGMYLGKIGLGLFGMTLLVGFIIRDLQVQQLKKAAKATAAAEGESQKQLPTLWSPWRIVSISVGSALIYAVVCSILIASATMKPWQVYRPKSGVYKIALPSRPTEWAYVAPTLPKMEEHYCIGTPPGRFKISYSINYYDLQNRKLPVADPKEFLQRQAERFLRINYDGGTVTTKGMVPDASYPSFDMAFNIKGRYSLARFILVKNRFYTLLATPIPYGNEQRIKQQFFQSFTIEKP